jgi:hypothetical protein
MLQSFDGENNNRAEIRCHCEVKLLLGSGIICVFEESSVDQLAFTWAKSFSLTARIRLE